MVKHKIYKYKNKESLYKLSEGMLKSQIIMKGGSYDEDMEKKSLINRLWGLGNGFYIEIKFRDE